MHTAVYNIKTFDGERAMPYYLFPGKHFVNWDNTKIIFLGAAHSHTTYQKPIYFVLKVKLWKGRIFQTIFYALEVKLFNILYSRMLTDISIECWRKKYPFSLKKNIAKGTTDPGVDYFDQ